MKLEASHNIMGERKEKRANVTLRLVANHHVDDHD